MFFKFFIIVIFITRLENFDIQESQERFSEKYPRESNFLQNYAF